VASEISVESTVKVVSRWLNSCQKHAGCAERPGFLPRRLLELPADGPPKPKLVETSALKLLSVPNYTTLSHCWGVPKLHAPPLRTTKSTYEARTRGIEWEHLPTVFRDAIVLTRALGCRYLWIDSLCIVQDDEQDWIEQSALMADIYSYGYLNIAAAATKGPSGSLFHERQELVCFNADRVPQFQPNTTHVVPPPAATIAPVQVRRSHQHTHACVLGHMLNGGDAICPLLRRGWVFQERLLSRRTVFFANSEMLWQCQERTCCECGGVENDAAVSLRLGHAEPAVPRVQGSAGIEDEKIQQRFAAVTGGRCSAQQVRDLWHDVVQQYSVTRLTQESDRPYAVAGIARRMHEATGDTYLAGLWLEDLPRGLLWYGLLLWSHGAWRRPGRPTWSWMSRAEPAGGGAPWLKNACTEDFQADSRLRVVAEGTFCSPKVGNAFGDVLDGQLRLEAAILPAVVEVIPQCSPRPIQHKLQFEGRVRDRYRQEARLDCPFDETEVIRTGDVVHCALIGADKSSLGVDVERLLVLRAGEGRPGVYQRVGIAEHSPGLFAEAPVAVATIV
jgi:hypothetical protein